MSEMKYNFPATIYVDQGSIPDQIHHVVSEAFEIDKAVQQAHDLIGGGSAIADREQALRHIEDELADATHSLETLWRKYAKTYGQAAVDAIFARIVEKNAERGYYSAPLESD